MESNQLAIVGSGPTAIYLLKHFLDKSIFLENKINTITIFEKRSIMGMGMPYTAETTDKYNLANISSEEIPELPQSFAQWLMLQKKEQLKKWNITTFPISESEVYSRIALGQYFHHQYKLLIEKLKIKGFHINELPDHQVTDISIDKNVNQIEIKVGLTSFLFSKVVIAIGHNWSEKDQSEKGYYASPWPIKKLLPKKNQYFNFEIGTLGSSLSALDIVTSLAHRHGKFIPTAQGLEFHLHKKAKGFKIILHSTHGWLPHLQYEQELPIREIYRHTTRSEILSLVNKNGFLQIDTFFDKICRPALIGAFKKDQQYKEVDTIMDCNFSFNDFINRMSRKHKYINSFLGMKKERLLAQDSLTNNKPIHWMETLDDLMYCLNFHIELLSAEDYLYFRKKVMPFLMNVIAALPLKSTNILLSLYEANCIDLVEGSVKILKNTDLEKTTKIKIKTKNGETSTKNFKMFINCSGQNTVTTENYPFQSLVKQGIVRKARTKFEKPPSNLSKNQKKQETFLNTAGDTYLYTSGIDIDATYRIISDDAQVQPTIYEATFAHIKGARPYSYGLQACNAISTIILDSWISLKENNLRKTSIEKITKLYEENENL
jgi:uncharacterized NAD(P)/FAD-binding protein YdhS